MFKLYLDIDGVLLTAKNKRQPEFLSEFIDFILDTFDCYWLTTHCKGNSQTAINYLAAYLNDELIEKLKAVKPTNWTTLKTEAIKLSYPFYWLDDAPLHAETDFLQANGLLDHLIVVDLEKNNGLKSTKETLEFLLNSVYLNTESELITYLELTKVEPINKYLGCLLGGAIGDALGAPVEFNDISEILDTYGNSGINDFYEYPNNVGEFTDDTQMTLFTAEGLLNAFQEGIFNGESPTVEITYQSYLHWLQTQSVHSTKTFSKNSRLLEYPDLYKRRSPGATCLNSLNKGKMGTINKPLNDSKGCGGIMRVAPVGLLYKNAPEIAFKVGCEIAAITHGHPTGYLSAGFFACVISLLAEEMLPLWSAILVAEHILQERQYHEETLLARKSLS